MVDKVLPTLDKAPERSDRDVQFVWLKKAKAFDLAMKLDSLFEDRPRSDRPVIEPDSASNSLTIIAKRGDIPQIQDLVTRYYNNFGRENAENFADFYAEDAELILGERHFKGRNGIMEAYGRAPGQAPRPPPPPRFSFIVAIDNPLIVVHGKDNTATAQLVFTEYVIEKQGEQAKVITQGKEYSTFVKVNGHWRYKTRLIKAGTTPPEGWKE